VFFISLRAPAVSLALELDQPRRLLHVVEEALADDSERAALSSSSSSSSSASSSSASASGLGLLDDAAAAAPSPAVHALLLALTDAQLGRLLRHCRDWNTHGRHALVAHRLLAALFRTRRPAALKRLPELKEVLPALVPYTERHFARLDALLQKSFLCVENEGSLVWLCLMNFPSFLLVSASFVCLAESHSLSVYISSL
jgi:U3 small nucleolar RNA-associated protein 13